MRGEREKEVYRRESKTMRGEKAIAGRWNKTMRGKKKE